MSEQQIRVVLFDVGNVIVRATHAITHAILEDYGIAPENARRFFTSGDYAEFSRGNTTGEEFVRRFMSEYLRTSVPSSLELRIAHDAHMYGVDMGTIEVLNALRRRSIAIAFATNTNAWQTRRERDLVDLSRWSRLQLRSHELHALKRDPGTFERIVEVIQSSIGPSRPEAREILFVDDLPENVAMAERVGMSAIQFTSAAQIRYALVARGLLTA